MVLLVRRKVSDNIGCWKKFLISSDLESVFGGVLP